MLSISVSVLVKWFNGSVQKSSVIIYFVGIIQWCDYGEGSSTKSVLTSFSDITVKFLNAFDSTVA